MDIIMSFWPALVFLLCAPPYLLTSAAAIKTTKIDDCSSEKGLTFTHVYSSPGEENEKLQTVHSDEQNLVFRHYIHLQTPAADCEKNKQLNDLLSRLQALESEMKELKEKCDGCCGGSGGCSNCNGHGKFDPKLGSCQCDEGWEGDDCATKSCPNNCAGNGRCIDGICQCAQGYSGPDCSEKVCPFDCGKYGTCVDGSCKCEEGFSGPACRKKKCPFDCGEYGTCVDGICQCSEGYTGPACRKKKCPVDCGEHGKCIDGSCKCSEGYRGVDCKEKKCAIDCGPNGRCVDGQCICNDGFMGSSCSIEIASLCSGHGKYQMDTGGCQCDDGWEGTDCSQRSCPNNCDNNGVCVDGVCQCFSGYTGLDCSNKECPFDCGEHGTCVDGSCKCSVGYTGLTCREEDCIVGCGENGRCDGGQCFCEEGFTGETCSEVIAMQNLQLLSVTEDSLNIAWDMMLEVDYYLLVYYPMGNEGLKKEIQVSVDQDTYQIMGLAAGTEYKVLMYHAKNGMTSQPAELLAKTDSISLGTLWVAEETEDSLEVEWENPLVNVDHYKLKYAEQPNGAERELIVSQSQDPKSRYTITGLQPSTSYKISVQTVRSGQEGKPATAVGTTGIDGPKNLVTTKVGEDTASLSWKASLADIDKYMLSYSSPDGSTEEISLGKEKISTSLSNLTPGTEYIFYLWAEKDAKRSKRTSVTAVTEIDPPKNLQFSDSQQQASLTWNPPIAQIDGYVLVLEDSDGGRQEIELDSAVNNFELKDLKKGLKYTVYLLAFKGNRRSIQVSTNFYTDIDPPTNLQSIDVTQTEASLTWTPPTAQIDGYILTYTDADGNTEEIQLDSSSRSFALKNLKKGLKYTVYLKAFKGDRRSSQASTIFHTVAIIITHPSDCSQVQQSGNRQSGVYTIYPAGDPTKGVRAYCDQETDGGGWTVFQRRSSGKLDFYQRWRTYVEGFGDPSDEFWLGLEWIHKMTSSPATNYEIRVDLRSGDESVYALYRTFRVGTSRDRYKLSIGDYSGTAGDALTYHNGWKFSTWDKDNDIALTNCALSHRGAFWYKNCHLANLNGQYGGTGHSQGVNWEPWKGHEFSIPFAEMKMRPKA